MVDQLVYREIPVLGLDKTKHGIMVYALEPILTIEEVSLSESSMREAQSLNEDALETRLERECPYVNCPVAS